MITNFSHMDKWPDDYKILLQMEDIMLSEKCSELEKYFMMGNPYVVVMSMVCSLIEINGITDDSIRAMYNEMVKPETKKHMRVITRVLCYIIVLNKAGYISLDSAERLKRIVHNGGIASECSSRFIKLVKERGTDKDVPSYCELFEKTPEEFLCMAEEMYEDIYRETYLFANQYMPESIERANKRGNPQNRYNMQTKAKTEKNSVLASVVTVGVIILFVVACVGLAMAGL